MYAKPGTPCNDYIGYCDVFQKCREVDPSGPLATLRKLLLSEESIASFKKWVISNWYAVSLIIVAVFALLVSVCVHCNSTTSITANGNYNESFDGLCERGANLEIIVSVRSIHNLEEAHPLEICCAVGEENENIFP